MAGRRSYNATGRVAAQGKSTINHKVETEEIAE